MKRKIQQALKTLMEIYCKDIVDKESIANLKETMKWMKK